MSAPGRHEVRRLNADAAARALVSIRLAGLEDLTPEQAFIAASFAGRPPLASSARELVEAGIAVFAVTQNEASGGEILRLVRRLLEE